MMDDTHIPTPPPLCGCEPPCPTFEVWTRRHCYSCGEPYDKAWPPKDHAECFE